jgi:formamidopyrimidine-DNA glycosylase
MPELPEVETVRRDLQKYLVNKKIQKVKIKNDFANKIFPKKTVFVKLLENKKLLNVDRVGKLLILNFGKDKKLLAHLKMTGQFVFVPSEGDIIQGGHPVEQTREKPDKYNKVIFDFGSSGVLYFNDMRKFGYLKVVTDSNAELEKSRYGIEPIDKKFTFAKFSELINKRPNLEIKKFLLMQDFISGVGNIYVDESCFMAGIMCYRKIRTLTLDEQKLLYSSLKKILKKAVEMRGTSVNTYVDGSGKKGNYVKYLKVYSRVGEKCLKCKKATIKKMKVAGRGTSYCEICQK